MFRRALPGLAVGLALGASGVTPIEAQFSGRIIVNEAPIAVDVVFGPGYRAVGHVASGPRRRASAPVRYRVGMSMWELERYLDRIEYEYDLYRRMNWRDARYRLGWTREQLRDYVRFLRDERKFLRAEQRRLQRLYRAELHRDQHPGRGRAHGRGSRVALGLAQVW